LKTVRLSARRCTQSFEMRLVPSSYSGLAACSGEHQVVEPVPGHPSADPGPRPARGLAVHLGELEVVGDFEVVALVVRRVHRLVRSVWYVRLTISYLDGPNTSTQFGKDFEEFRDVAPGREMSAALRARGLRTGHIPLPIRRFGGASRRAAAAWRRQW
jgi:hypothetical protein